MDVSTLLGIREIFVFVDLELPVLLDKSDDGESIVFERVAVGSVERGCVLFPLVNVKQDLKRCKGHVWGDERGGQPSLVLQSLRKH